VEYAIELDKITKCWPGVTALNEISFQVKKGSIHGFLGPNGAGKSTTMNIISGLLPQTSGDVKVLGQDVRELTNETQKFIGFLPEHPPLYLSMKVRDYLEFVTKINLQKSDFKTCNVKDCVQEIIERCSLQKVAGRLIGNLSKGFRQRVAIAAALVTDPEIVILDEPTVGLDPVSIIEIRELILSLRERHTILLSTHILHEVSLLCSDITIINNGRILSSGPINEIQKNFNVGRILKTEVQTWSDDKKDYFFKQFDLDSLDINKKADSVELTFYLKGMEDIRTKLSSDLINMECGLLAFSEEKIDIESFFKKITEKDNLQRIHS
jgi:ABC-2 type transport system ATP-binding protein